MYTSTIAQGDIQPQGALAPDMQLWDHKLEKRRKVVLRPFNFPDVPKLATVEPSLLNKLITIQGTVVALSKTIPVAASLDYDCVKCKGRQSLMHLDTGAAQRPIACRARQCRSRSMKAVVGSAETVLWRCAWVMVGFLIGRACLCIAMCAETTAHQAALRPLEQGRASTDEQTPAAVPIYLTLDLTEGVSVGQFVEYHGIVKNAVLCAAGRMPCLVLSSPGAQSMA